MLFAYLFFVSVVPCVGINAHKLNGTLMFVFFFCNGVSLLLFFPFFVLLIYLRVFVFLGSLDFILHLFAFQLHLLLLRYMGHFVTLRSVRLICVASCTGGERGCLLLLSELSVMHTLS